MLVQRFFFQNLVEFMIRELKIKKKSKRKKEKNKDKDIF
jgi:hypothetical protein